MNPVQSVKWKQICTLVQVFMNHKLNVIQMKYKKKSTADRLHKKKINKKKAKRTFKEIRYIFQLWNVVLAISAIIDE